MSNNLETVFENLHDEEVKAQAEYEQLYRDIAEDKELDSRTMLDIIRRAERTSEELESDAKWQRERNKNIAKYKQLPDLEATLAQVSSELKELGAAQKKLMMNTMPKFIRFGPITRVWNNAFQKPDGWPILFSANVAVTPFGVERNSFTP